MAKQSQKLKGTRHVAKSRLAAVVVLSVLFLSYLAATYGLRVGAATIAATTPSSTSGNSTTISANSSAMTSTTSTLSNSTTTLAPDIYGVDPNELLKLVNDTNAQFTQSTGQQPYYVVSDGGRVTGLVFLTTDVALYYSYGFHGPIGLLVYITPAGIIQSILLWTSVEPMTYDITPQYLATYTNRSVFDQLAVGSDIVGITGATYSSVGIAGGIREGGRAVVNDYKQTLAQLQARTAIQTETQSLNETTTNELTVATSTSNETQSASPLALLHTKPFDDAGTVVAFFTLAAVAYETNSNKLRYAILGGAVVVLGFYQISMISVTDATFFLTRTFPPILTEYYWYFLYAGAIVTSLVWGRLYCGSLCPFGAFIHLLYTILPFRYVMPKRIHNKLIYVKYVVLALVVLGIAWSAMWVIKIEPFVVFFVLRGDSWMWGVLGFAVLFSVPFDRFYCSYICPAGAGLSVLGGLRVKEINRWSECAKCKICERDCPTGAISGGKISAMECMNCRTCEANYLNASLCPHYALQRAGHASVAQ